MSATASAINRVDLLRAIQERKIWDGASPLRIHLGCGDTYLPGYINVDYPQSEHNIMAVRPDVEGDIIGLVCASQVLDEIRLAHVFEHFNRVTALALLIRWHEWLKVGGTLQITTPDLMGSARNLITSENWRVVMGTVRHLVGDQTAYWGYHVDQWFPERYRHTLTNLGFNIVSIKSSSWAHEPFLCNVDVIASKTQHLSREKLIQQADAILAESTVSPQEAPSFQKWCEQLRSVLNYADPGNGCGFQQQPLAVGQASPAARLLQLGQSGLPLNEIHNFNQGNRDVWMKEKSKTVLEGSRVLDIGAGSCPYRELFSRCEYKTHDFKQLAPDQLLGANGYGQIDYVSDISEIDAPAASFDVIVCTEVLEHIPDPGDAIREMARLLKSGGRLFLTAPLGSGLHQLPYHFYGGFTPKWYEHFLARYGLRPLEITPNGGFYALLSQECVRAAGWLVEDPAIPVEHKPELFKLFAEQLPKFLYGFEERRRIDQFTVGYHVEAVKL